MEPRQETRCKNAGHWRKFSTCKTFVNKSWDGPIRTARLADSEPLASKLESKEGFWAAVKSGYKKSIFFGKIMTGPTAFRAFTVREGLICTKNRQDEEV